MSESLSPPPEDHELEIAPAHVDDDDDGISTDTSSSIPGSPGAEEDGEVITICKWDECNQDMTTLDALVRHVHDCMFCSLWTCMLTLRYNSPHRHPETSVYV